jgi:hypothetical protein
MVLIILPHTPFNKMASQNDIVVASLIDAHSAYLIEIINPHRYSKIKPPARLLVARKPFRVS